MSFTTAISLATGFLFGAMPAIRASRANVAEALKEESRSTGRGRPPRRLRQRAAGRPGGILVSLAGDCGPVPAQYRSRLQLDPGFQTRHLAVFMTNPGQAGFSKPRTKAFYKEMTSHVARLPGIASVSSASWNSAPVESRRERPSGARAPAAIAYRQHHDHRRYHRTRLLRYRGSHPRSRPRFQRHRPRRLRPRWPSSTRNSLTNSGPAKMLSACVSSCPANEGCV